MALACLLSACAYVPPGQPPGRLVSPDYTATGTAGKARAYMYGQATVLEFDSSPMVLAVVDEQGRKIEYERAGRVFRLERALSNFTVWADGQSTTFAAIPVTRVFVARSPAATAVVEIPARATAAPDAASNTDQAALLRLCKLQLFQTRSLLNAAAGNAKITGGELFGLETRLSEIEQRMMATGDALVRVQFPTGGTMFEVEPSVSRVLVDNAKRADQIIIRGRTDANVPGRLDPRIAGERAAAAQSFLLAHGIRPEKISMSSLSAGDFIAPNQLPEARAANRRVEIELVGALKDFVRSGQP